MWQKIRRLILGKPLDPLSKTVRHQIALVAFLAWVGLGADGLSSSCYGPEEAFLALGKATHLALYLAVMTAATVFIISLSYTQVIELFPNGGGGYRVATTLLGENLGLISGCSLLVDYVLTIAISIASGTDTIFSTLPYEWGKFRLFFECISILGLIVINLRGIKESIVFLLPIFVGFVITHFILIVLGIILHKSSLPNLIPATIEETNIMKSSVGWATTIGLLLRAYSLGGGTYTGIEAVSNNVHSLAEPRLKTGRLTMLYIALSLSFMAGGIIILYLLWDVHHVEGMTLNAVTFSMILHEIGINGWLAHSALVIILFLETALLFVAANTGFLAGPTVLSNMAIDSWVPRQFRHLSIRLVTQNGILMMGVAALFIILLSQGQVKFLIVLYSINVFLTFSLTLSGLSLYWWKQRKTKKNWIGRFMLSFGSFLLTASILVVTAFVKFSDGGWLTLLITSAVIICCIWIKNHYSQMEKSIESIDESLAHLPYGTITNPVKLSPNEPTAAFIIGSSRGVGMHDLRWVQKMFPNHFKNFVFINVETVDAESYVEEIEIKKIRQEAMMKTSYFVNFCNSHGLSAKQYIGFGIDTIEEIFKLSERVETEFSNVIFFSSHLTSKDENWVTRLLHSNTPFVLQKKMHAVGMNMVILPLQV
ncbi:MULTISPECIES: APC family permease [Candidatus Ichthyocystis]|uniref:APC family permease n=1 Tax=Candidatus Ichthyocystis TaxID=2929841 RepID=UPI000B199807|nr:MULTISPECIES: APC family permease [Ichthyocystis]